MLLLTRRTSASSMQRPRFCLVGSVEVISTASCSQNFSKDTLSVDDPALWRGRSDPLVRVDSKQSERETALAQRHNLLRAHTLNNRILSDSSPSRTARISAAGLSARISFATARIESRPGGRPRSAMISFSRDRAL